MGNTYDKAHFRFSGNHQFYGPVCSDLSCKSLICSSAAEFFMILFGDLLDVCMAMHGPLAYGDIPMLQGHKNTLFTALRTGNHRPWPAIPEEDLNQEPHYGHFGHFGLLSCQLDPNIDNSWGSTDVIHVRKQPLGSMQRHEFDFCCLVSACEVWVVSSSQIISAVHRFARLFHRFSKHDIVAQETWTNHATSDALEQASKKQQSQQ